MPSLSLFLSLSSLFFLYRFPFSSFLSLAPLFSLPSPSRLSFLFPLYSFFLSSSSLSFSISSLFSFLSFPSPLYFLFRSSPSPSLYSFHPSSLLSCHVFPCHSANVPANPFSQPPLPPLFSNLPPLPLLLLLTPHTKPVLCCGVVQGKGCPPFECLCLPVAANLPSSSSLSPSLPVTQWEIIILSPVIHK